MVVIDAYSEYIEIKKMNTTRSMAVIRVLSEMFALHGVCNSLFSDNGPQFSSEEFKSFSTKWKFKHVTGDHTYPQSNGLAERAVQTAKQLIKKCREDKSNVYPALMNLRNTPCKEGVGSPAQRLFGRRTKTLLPTSNKLLKPTTQEPEEVKQQLKVRRNQSKQIYDQHANPLKSLEQHDTIRVKDRERWLPARILNIPNKERPRSYHIISPTGGIWRRNRKDILKTRESNQFKEEYEDLDLGVNEENQRQPIAPDINRIQVRIGIRQRRPNQRDDFLYY